jgi:Holliday junction DNA helicase RuvA
MGAADTDVLSALSALGYSSSEAAKAVVALPKDPSISLEDKVRLALAGLSKG